jgi:hypothetical protein
MTSINRREHPRIDVRLVCRMDSSKRWPARWTGSTENISRHGILIKITGGAQDAPRVGEAVSVEVDLPANHGFARKCIRCQADIVRVGPLAGGGLGVALSTAQMQFREHLSRPAAWVPAEMHQ